MVKFIQRVTGKFLYYARAIDNTMLHALNDIASSKNTNQTIAATRYFLNYAASNPNGSIIYRVSPDLTVCTKISNNSSSLYY
jgi:hypothetical protein